MTWGRISLIEGDCHRQWRAPSRNLASINSWSGFANSPYKDTSRFTMVAIVSAKKSEFWRRIWRRWEGSIHILLGLLTHVQKSSPTDIEHIYGQQKQAVILLQPVVALILVPLLQEAFGVDLNIIEVCDSRSTWDSREDLRDSSWFNANMLSVHIRKGFGTLRTISEGFDKSLSLGPWYSVRARWTVWIGFLLFEKFKPEMCSSTSVKYMTFMVCAIDSYLADFRVPSSPRSLLESTV